MDPTATRDTLGAAGTGPAGASRGETDTTAALVQRGTRTAPISPAPITRPLVGIRYVAATRPTRRVTRGIRVALVLALVVFVLGGASAALAITQAAAPSQTALFFCQDLRASQPGAAYALLAASVRRGISASQFGAITASLDTAEGAIIGCKAANTGNLLTFATRSAVVPVVLTRGKLGELSGSVRLERTGSVWRITALDTSLLGANLDALATIATFCARMRTQHYAAAYTLLDAPLQAQVSAQNFSQAATTHDTLDGRILACGMAAIGQSNTDSSTQVTLSISRATHGTLTGVLRLGRTADGWKIVALDGAMQGTDLSPLQAGMAFCAALAARGTVAAYGLLAASAQASLSYDAFAVRYGGQSRWVACRPVLSSYLVAMPGATYTLQVTQASAPRGSATHNVALALLRQDGAWRIASITPQP